MLDPSVDADNLIQEFGTRVIHRSIRSDYDSGTGDPINSYSEKTIYVIPYSLTSGQIIQNPVSLLKDSSNFTTRFCDNVKINDEILIGSSTYILIEVIEHPSFSHVPSKINNSSALISFRGELKQTSA